MIVDSEEQNLHVEPLPVETSTTDLLQKNPHQYEFVIEPATGRFRLNFRELWAYRDLLYFLTWRDIKVRYKQAALGIAWAILQPLLTMLIFTVIFGRFAQMPSNGFPYAIYTYAALLPWQIFAYALSTSTNSLVVDQELITKVYFPRIFVPLSSVLVGLVDFVMAFIVLLGLLAWYGVALSWAILTLPLFLLLALASAAGVGLLLSALNVEYRDVRYTVTFLSQIWLFATPIAYPTSIVPDRWQLVYGLNPMVSVVDGFRWAILGQEQQLGIAFYISMVMIVLLLLGGVTYFQRTERSFADVI